MKTKVWAHRGASAYAPENTLEAFQLAVDQKADGVELDVQMTKDGKLVVIHDGTIDRTSDGHGRVMDHTLSELKKMKFNRTHPEYADATIPTLAEVYELLKPAGLEINVEIKTGIIFYPEIEERLYRLESAYVFPVCCTDHTGKHFYTIGSAGSCFVLPEPSQIIFCNGIAFEFNMIPPAIFHYIVKILIHFPSFQMYQLRRGDSFYRFFYAQPPQ